jgi:hypothetical protein
VSEPDMECDLKKKKKKKTRELLVSGELDNRDLFRSEISMVFIYT